jgi:xyloglucan-specific exo-beta-1,4-glucanase
MLRFSLVVRPLLVAVAASALVVLAGGRPARAQATAAYDWKPVSIGALGFVTGMVIHPGTPSLKYVRTDVGGAYRWNYWAEWTPITEQLCQDGAGSIESIAVDVKNVNTLYLAAGNRVYKSTNQGGTWAATGLSVPTDGNAPWRSTGERLAVDPNKNNIVYFGSRSNGLYRTTNGGTGWTNATNLPQAGDANIGVTFVTFDKRLTNTGGATRIIYAGVAGVGVYRSSNAGSSWTLLGGGPTPAADYVPQRCAVSSTGSAYFTYAKKANWGNPGGGGIYKYPGSGSTLTNVTPRDGAGNRRTDLGYCAVTVSPTDPNFLMAAEWRFSSDCAFFRTTDGGANWNEVGKNVTSGASWWPSYLFATGPAAMVIDPETPTSTWMTDGASPWRTDDNRWDYQYWYAYPRGIEELVGTVVARPKGSTGDTLLTGVMDVVGFTTTNFTQTPNAKWDGADYGNTTGLDWCEAQPAWAYRVVSNGGDARASVSYDRGQNWYALPVTPYSYGGGRIAVSGGGDNLVFLGAGWVKPRVSYDRGNSWVEANFPEYVSCFNDFYTVNVPLVSDRVNAGTFYLYGNNGTFYRSTDGGSNWAQVGAQYALPYWFMHCVRAAPYRGGEVWISFTGAGTQNGLYRSGDGGATWAKLAQVTDVSSFAFGKAAPGLSNTSTVYVYGTVNGVRGVFRSNNVAQTTGDGSAAVWTHLNNGRPLPPAVWGGIEADRDTYGVVYLGTTGRGYFVGKPL